jgi:DNA replication protein DnaC
LSRRTEAADFHRLNKLEDFNRRFNPGIPRKQIYNLATSQFIRQSADLLLIGPPGVGKTHLA